MTGIFGVANVDIALGRCFYSADSHILKTVIPNVVLSQSQHTLTFEWMPQQFNKEVHLNYCLLVVDESQNILAQSDSFPIVDGRSPVCVQPNEATASFKSHLYRDLMFNPQRDQSDRLASPESTNVKVGIIGAGVSGLYAAMKLKEHGIDYEILEANKDRIGGRVFTRNWSRKSKHQYAELGAMRLPGYEDLKSDHAPVYQLIKKLNSMTPKKFRIDLTEFYMSDDDENTRSYYGNVRGADGEVMTSKEAEVNHHRVSEKLFPGLSDEFRALPGDLVALFEDYYKAAYQCDAAFGAYFLMQFERHSLQSFLSEEMKYPYEAISIVELFSYSNSYSRGSFGEVIADDLEFNAARWATIDGGMSRLVNAMAKVVGRNKILMGKTVYEIQKVMVDGEIKYKVLFESADDTKFAIYDRLIITAPATIVRHWQMPEDFSPRIMQAIRKVNYDHSCKAYMRFRKPFWRHIDRPIKSGQSVTDLSIKKVVYPYYGPSEPIYTPAVLCASYTWAADAEGIETFSEDKAKQCMLRNLESVHGLEPGSLTDELMNFEVRKWSQCEYTRGSFAFFRPGELQNELPILMQSEDGMYFAGEHTDVHHAWIVGAINSAERATEQMFEDLKVSSDLSFFNNRDERLS